MPSQIMDQRDASTRCMQSEPSSSIPEQFRFPVERQVGFWKHQHVINHSGRLAVTLMSESKSFCSPPLEKIRTQAVDAESTAMSMTAWRVGGEDYGLHSDLSVQAASVFVDTDKAGMNEAYYESGPFSSSLSEIFNQKLKLSAAGVPLGQSVDTVNFNLGENEPFESLEDIEAQTIGDLLPNDDDDLLAGAAHALEYGVRLPSAREDIHDIFCTGGGMELEEDNRSSRMNLIDSIDEVTSNGNHEALHSQFTSKPRYGEHPSRTLIVTNLNDNVEDTELKALFEQFGDIRALSTACKSLGFVMISYYDIRAARNAMVALQHKPLRHHKLDIHFAIPKDISSEEDINQATVVVFNLDSSVSTDDIHQVFGVYGGIKEVRKTPLKHHKIIEYYDVRAAEAALRFLNRTDIAGKKIKLEPIHPGVARQCLMQHLTPELELEESCGCLQGSCRNNSPAEYYVPGPIPRTAITSHGFSVGAVQRSNNAARTPTRPDMEIAFQGTYSGVPHTFVSPVDNHSNPSDHGELSNSFGQMKFGYQCMPGFLPGSLPPYHDRMQHDTPHNLSSIPPNVINSTIGEGVDDRHIHEAGFSSLSNHSAEHNESEMGFSGDCNCASHANQYTWHTAATYHHHPPGPSMWPNSPVFVSNVLPQMHGLPGASHILNTVLPLPHHNLGSASTTNPSLLDRRQVYPAEMHLHAFYPGSVGSMGLSGVSRSISPRDGGYYVDSARVGTPPRHRRHTLHRRNPMGPASFEAPRDRMRCRNIDSSANQENKKEYELDIDSIVRGEDSRTTLMIRNIPNKYTCKTLLAAIDEHYRGTYDFIYLPIDFRNKCNMGYAFINIIDPQQIIPFYQEFNGKKWEKFSSEKVAELAYARIQGKAALITHFQNSSLMTEDKWCRPLLFHSGGPNAGDQEPFPLGFNIRSRRGRLSAGYQESHQGCLSTSPSEEGRSMRTLSS